MLKSVLHVNAVLLMFCVLRVSSKPLLRTFTPGRLSVIAANPVVLGNRLFTSGLEDMLW
ncbi:hypothetical protein D3C87_1322650 [compost metagenome]